MSIARKILYAVGTAVLLLVVVGVFLPSQVHVSREIGIDAPAATVFALLSDTRRRQEWSPWIGRKSGSEFVYSGPRRGRGASIQWSSATGAGRQTVREARPFESVVLETDLEGSPPFVSTFKLEETTAGTRVALAFETDLGMNLLRRYSRGALVKRIASVYGQGLAELKSMAENLPRADFSDLRVEHISLEAAPMASLTTSSEPNAAAISEAMGAAFFQILRFMDRHGLSEAGAPLSINRNFSGSRLVFDAAIPVRSDSGNLPASAGGVKITQSYGGPVVRVTHTGSYADLPRTHEKVTAYLEAYGIERNGDAWESYESDPARTPEPDLRTYVYYPVKEAPAAEDLPIEVPAPAGSGH